MLKLINDDCLNAMKDIEDNSIDLCFCDLPWSATTCNWDIAIDLELFWKEIKRIIKKNTPIFMCTNAKYGNTLINSNRKWFRYDICWIKSAPVGFLNSKKQPMRAHELIYVFYKHLPFYDLSSHEHKFIKKSPMSKKPDIYGRLWNKKTGEPYVKEKISNKYNPPLPTSVIKNIDEKYKNKGGLYSKISRNGLLKAEPHYSPPLPTSILKIKSTRKHHSTEKPENLIKFILKYYSKENDIILDPTMGSGSCGVVCKKMNRNFIGIEQDKKIFDYAVKRINKD